MSNKAKKSEEKTVAKIDREAAHKVLLPRYVKGGPTGRIDYLGVQYVDADEYEAIVIEDNPGLDIKDLRTHLYNAYQSGKFIHAAQRLETKGELAEGQEVEYTHVVGLKRRASKWGALAAYVDAAKSRLKGMGVEVNDDNIKRLAQKISDDIKANEAEYAAILGLDVKE